MEKEILIKKNKKIIKELKKIKKLIEKTTNPFIKKILINEYDYIYFNQNINKGELNDK